MLSKTDFPAGCASHARQPLFLRSRHALAALLLATSTTLALAIQPPAPPPDAMPRNTAHAQDLDVQPELESTLRLAPGASRHAGTDAFLARHDGEWEVRWDRRADRPELVQGSGIALLPGKGNALSARSLGLADDASVDLAFVEARLRDFIAANDDLLRSGGMEFRLDPASSTPYGDGSTHWFIEFAQYAHGLRVKDAHLFFRLSHGNIVQFGSHLAAPVTLDATPASSAANAFDLAVREMDFPAGTAIGEVIEPGELLFLPVTADGADAHDAFLGAAGAGYAHRLAWRFVFRVEGNASTYEVYFDAKANRLVDVRDLNDYVDATVSGGVYPTTNTDPEVIVPFPYTSVSNGGARITDALGIYDYVGGSATVTLNGQYFQMADNCGSISLANSTDGNLNLGSGAGTDCTTPGFGGNGNTHASRTGFYHLTKINEKARAILPTNNWLRSKVKANMNVNDVCNAYWDGSQLNFFKSGTYSGMFCSNTGEIAAVFLHEWGHGLDTNTGGAANEYGSGEAVGDTFAFLETRDACIGKNFTPGRPCHNCNATCTGVRDLAAFAIGGSHTIAKPANVTSSSGIDCGAYIGRTGVACPYVASTGAAYRGPMGWEGHCESYIASSANWDLTQALVARYGADAGYAAMDRIWYGSLTPSKSAYRVASGGTCNANASVDGCASSNWYTVFLAADDDDGNLANGTPNACLIWDAMNAHGIACGARPACSATQAYTIGGTIGCLAGSGLRLSLNSGLQTLDIAAGAASFTFPTAVADGTPYDVEIDTQPGGQTCTLASNTGTVSGADVTSIAVVCATTPAAYSVGGSISGLDADGLRLSLNNGAQTLDVAAGATGFVFPTALADGSAYDVEIDAQPDSLACTLSANTGSISGADVTSIVVTCAAIPTYAIGGSVSGLSTAGLKLSLNNGAQTLDVAAASTGFQFATGLPEGATYDVRIATQPTDLVCAIANNVGTVGSTDVDTVTIVCAPPVATYSVAGSVVGLSRGGMRLSLNDGQIMGMTANVTAFTFPVKLPDGTPYVVKVQKQPDGLFCAVRNDAGTITGANVDNVIVDCLDRIFANGFDGG